MAHTLQLVSMILTIPHHTFEVSNIHLTPFQVDRSGKAIARLAYKDNSIDFHDVSILSPPLTVIDYQPDTSRLRVDLTEHLGFQTKLATLQDYLVSTFFTHQQSLLNVSYQPYEVIQRLFYFLLDGVNLSLFIYPTVAVKKEDGSPSYVAHLKKGDVIRCVIRLQGISQMINHGSLRLRLHHSVPAVWGL